MKSKILSTMLCAAVCTGLLVGTQTAALAAENGSEEREALKIGATIQDLGQFWSAVMQQIEVRANEAGDTFTYVSCEDSSSKQIEQMENFISSGCDVILVHPSDPNAVESVCKQAQEKGIKVMCWDNSMTNTDLNWVIDNVELGYLVGQEAADFIEEKFGDETVEVAVLGYPQTEVLREREEGILKALEELAPNAEIVANQPALDTPAALSVTETILQAHPDLKVVCTVGCVRSLGANEAFKAAGLVGDEYGIFGVDATDDEMKAILDDEPIRMSAMITGTAKTCGDEVYDLLADLGSGKTFEERDIYRDVFAVTAENAEEYYGK